jgi:hypothetical protein
MQVTRKQAKDIDKASETLITCRSHSDSSLVGDSDSGGEWASKRRGVTVMEHGEERVVAHGGTVVLLNGRWGGSQVRVCRLLGGR